MRRRLRDRPRGPEEERLFDLMRERAVSGLEAKDLEELERLAQRSPDVDVDCYDRAAAALDLGWLAGRCEPMPAELRARVLAQAPAQRASAPSGTAPTRGPATVRRARGPGALAWSGWIVAAAAAVLAFLGWTRELEPASPADVIGALRAQVDTASDRIVLPWKPTEDPDGRNVSGELHWSTALQKGYMVFHGLPRNDPSAKQYQLWIFDKPRGDAHPVDGGVFDVAAADEAVIPIEARIRVFDPALFAVTAEPPGGVVVSGREHIVSLAQL